MALRTASPNYDVITLPTIGVLTPILITIPLITILNMRKWDAVTSLDVVCIYYGMDRGVKV